MTPAANLGAVGNRVLNFFWVHPGIPGKSICPILWSDFRMVADSSDGFRGSRGFGEFGGSRRLGDRRRRATKVTPFLFFGFTREFRGSVKRDEVAGVAPNASPREDVA